MKSVFASLLWTLQSSLSAGSETNFWDTGEMIRVIFPHFSFSGYAVPVESLAIGLVVCLVVYFSVVCTRRLYPRERFKFTVNMLQTMYEPLLFLRNGLEDIAAGNLSDSASGLLKQAVGIADCLMDTGRNILTLDEIGGKLVPGFSVTQVELYTYILSVVDRCRPYAEFRGVRLSAGECTGYAGCEINEPVLTCALQRLLNKIIEMTAPGGFVRVYVSHTVNARELYISSGKEPERGSCEKKFPFIPSMFPVYGYGEFWTIRKMIRLQGGKIVGYRYGKAVTFCVVIPGVYLSDPQTTGTLFPKTAGKNGRKEEEETSVFPGTISISRAAARPSVLLIMSDNGFSGYLSEVLSEYFNISIRADPDSAIETLTRQRPDAIILDEAVNGGCGDKLCRQIKGQQGIMNIPVMLLVRSDDSENYFSHIQSGADRLELWTARPGIFRADLILLINNGKERQTKQKPDPQKEVSAGVPGKVRKNADKQEFVDKVRLFIKATIDGGKAPTVEMLGDHMGMSPTGFRTKMEKYTGISPVKYIYYWRMEKAAQLLLTETASVAEVAYAVGYSDPKYFGKEFKRCYQVPPTEYVQIMKSGGNIPSPFPEGCLCERE